MFWNTKTRIQFIPCGDSRKKERAFKKSKNFKQNLKPNSSIDFFLNVHLLSPFISGKVLYSTDPRLS